MVSASIAPTTSAINPKGASCHKVSILRPHMTARPINFTLLQGIYQSPLKKVSCYRIPKWRILYHSQVNAINPTVRQKAHSTKILMVAASTLLKFQVDQSMQIRKLVSRYILTYGNKIQFSPVTCNNNCSNFFYLSSMHCSKCHSQCN